jgi:hypothetical protein
MSKDIKLQYITAAIMNICNDIDERIRKFETEYKEMKFGKQFFLDIEVRNVLMDLIYYRDEQLKAHLQLCRMLKIDKNQFAVEIAMYRLKWLKDIELNRSSYIKIIHPMFGLSEVEQKRRNEELSRLVNEILAEEQAAKV